MLVSIVLYKRLVLIRREYINNIVSTIRYRRLVLIIRYYQLVVQIRLY